MVDRYCRKIEDVENDIENAMQISSILLKLKGYDDDLEKIDTNENNISTNLSKINNNETNISSNSSKIDDIKTILPKSEILKKTYSIKNQSFQFNKDIIYFKLLEIEIENNFNKDGNLEFDNYIYYKYDKLQRDHHRLQHEYRILDDKNNLLHKKILNKTNTSDLDFDKNIMLVKDNFYVTFKNNYNKIKIILDLYRVYKHGTGNFNLELINENFVNVSYLDKNDISLKIEDNLSKINTNTADISSNLSQINDNQTNIANNLKQISTNTESISTNLEKIDNFTQYILQSGKDFEEKYTIEKQIFRFSRNKHFYTLFEKEIEFDFTKNSLLFIKNNMYYKYENLSDDYHRLQHEYNIYDGDNLIHKYLFNKDTYYDESLDPILHTNEDFCICFKKNYNKIKINLQLHRHNRHGAGNINLEIDDDNENYINIDYLDRNNNEQVDTNARDISTNLIKINSNEDDILSNLNEINYLKNNTSKSYLKNIYNILFHNRKTQVSFKKYFLKKYLMLMLV